MAFWRLGNGFSSISAIDKILDKPEHSLVELLDEHDLLQELLAPNTKLIEYLREPQVMDEMINIIIDSSVKPEEKPADAEELKPERLPDEPEILTLTADRTSGQQQVEQEGKQSLEKLDETEATVLNQSKNGTTPTNTGTSAFSVENETDTPMTNADSDSDSDDDDMVNDDEDGLLQRVASHHSDEEDTDDSRDSEDQEHSFEEEEEEDQDGEYQETKQRQAQICTEILSADVWSITEALMERGDLLEQFWGILDHIEPLDISLASCFTKINEHLLDKKTGDMIVFIQCQNNFVQRFMKHIENPPLMDFLLKIISSDKPDNSTGIIDFLQGQKLIPSLIAFLGPDVPSSIQTSAGDFLKAFITISANSSNDNSTIGPNELSRELVSEPCISDLLRLMLHGGTGLATGVGVVIEIIRKNNSDYDFVPVMCVTMESHPPGPRDPIYLGILVKNFADAIPKFQEMLTREHSERLDTSFGVIEPLGFERFKVCELIAELLHCSNMALLNDPAGEEVVKARDDERQRVKNVVARARGEVFGDEDVANLSVEGEPEEKEKTAVATADDDTMQDVVNHEENKNEPTTPNAHLEQDLESLNIETPRAESEVIDDSKMSEIDDKMKEGGENPDPSTMSLEGYEAYLRANPVVGDRLKTAFADHGCITTILNMFFEFPWNNFLHNVVFDIVQQILNAPMQRGFNKYLAIDLFGSGKLTRVICEGHSKCDAYENKNGTRLGYMGHLTLISEEVVKFTALHSPESISPVVVAAVTEQEWINYVTHTLVQTRDQYNTILGGRRPDENDIANNPNTILVGNSEGFGEESDDVEDEGEQGQHFDDEDDHEKGSGQFVRYISEQMSGAGHFGSSDEEDEEDEWDHERNSIYRGSSQYAEYGEETKEAENGEEEEEEVGLGSKESDDEDGEENTKEGEENLELVRSHSYHDI